MGADAGRVAVITGGAGAIGGAIAVSRQALPRVLVPGDVAATVAFLASDAAAALTGQTLCVDGGLIPR